MGIDDERPVSGGQTSVRPGQTSTAKLLPLPGVPAIYVRLFADLVKSLGHDDRKLFAGMPFDRASLLASDARVSLSDAARLAERGLALAGHEGLGFRYASALKITLHGPVGLLATSSATVGDALAAASRYLGLRAPFLEFVWERDADLVTLEVRSRRDLGRHREFILEAMLLGLVYMTEQVREGTLGDAEIWMTGPEPAYYKRLSATLPVPVRYGMPRCVVRASAHLLDAEPRLADPAVAALALELCEAELGKLFADRRRVAFEVKALLAESEGELPSLARAAKSLGFSSRTLKRRLQDEATTYSELLEVERRERAVRYLRETDLHVSEIAFRLGYRDVANFSRAFRRWTGKNPSAYRAR